jgi:hypothetical protein
MPTRLNFPKCLGSGDNAEELPDLVDEKQYGPPIKLELEERKMNEHRKIYDDGG